MIHRRVKVREAGKCGRRRLCAGREIIPSELQFIEHQFINITPAPGFSRLKRFDNRMLSGAKVFGGVFVRRRVATADVAARHAEAQVQPGAATSQAVFTSFRTGRDRLDLIKMATFVSHNKVMINPSSRIPALLLSD